MGNYRQTMQPVPQVYTLPRCSVALYNTGSGDMVLGEPLGSLVWTAQQVENIRIGEWFDEVMQYGTNDPYPSVHHTLEHHEIIFDAIWNVGAQMARNTEYQLVLTFQDAGLSSDNSRYIRRCYYGVTTSRRNIDSRDGNEFTSSNVLRAKYKYETTSDGDPGAGAGTDGGYITEGGTVIDGITYIDLGGKGPGSSTFP